MCQHIKLTHRNPSDNGEDRSPTIHLIVRQCHIGVRPTFRIIRAIIYAHESKINLYIVNIYLSLKIDDLNVHRM
jgi:hypothetical protein